MSIWHLVPVMSALGSFAFIDSTMTIVVRTMGLWFSFIYTSCLGVRLLHHVYRYPLIVSTDRKKHCITVCMYYFENQVCLTLHNMTNRSILKIGSHFPKRQLLQHSTR